MAVPVTFKLLVVVIPVALISVVSNCPNTVAPTPEVENFLENHLPNI